MVSCSRFFHLPLLILRQPAPCTAAIATRRAGRLCPRVSRQQRGHGKQHHGNGYA